MTIKILPKKALIYLIYVTGSLLVLNIFSILYRLNFMPADALTHPYERHGLDALIFLLVRYFDFNEEVNFPTLYSTLLLVLCGILLMLIGYYQKSAKKKYVFWMLFSGIFIFLSFDEYIQIHEILIGFVRNSLNTSGLLYFAWVIPYGLLLIVLLIFSYKFLTRLPKKILKLFLISGAIYVFGALIIELPEGWVSENYGQAGKYYALLYTIEELLEMIGLNIFIYGLLTYSVFKIEID